MDGDVDINLNDRESDVLTIEASHKFEEWTGIREIGIKLVKIRGYWTRDGTGQLNKRIRKLLPDFSFAAVEENRTF